MNTQVKTILVIAITLVIGIVLGALIHGAVMENRIRDMAFRMRSDEGFMQRMEMIIQPDESQREAMRKILRKHFQRMSDYQEKFIVMMDSLRTELDSILTEEQRKRLERGPFRTGPRRFGPPFGKERPWKGKDRPFMKPDSARRFPFR